MPGKLIPTPNELMVLRLLWTQGPLTVRQIRDLIFPQKKFAYTTVLTIVNVLVKKGWLTRKRVGKADEYRPVLEEQTGKLFILQEISERLFDGALDELRRFVDLAKGRTNPPASLPSAQPPTSAAAPAHSRPETKPAKKPQRLPVQHLDVDLL